MVRKTHFRPYRTFLGQRPPSEALSLHLGTPRARQAEPWRAREAHEGLGVASPTSLASSKLQRPGAGQGQLARSHRGPSSSTQHHRCPRTKMPAECHRGPAVLTGSSQRPSRPEERFLQSHTRSHEEASFTCAASSYLLFRRDARRVSH